MGELIQIPTTLADGFVSWLLRSRDIDPLNDPVVLGWRFELPAWAWALIVVAAAVLAWAGYRRMLGNRAGRAVMGVGRALILLAIAALLAGPSLVLPRENEERDHVIMLVDRSASIGVADVTPGGAASERISRDKQLADLLAGGTQTWAKLAEQHEIDWYRFSDSLDQAASPTDLGEPGGRATAMRTAIEQAIQRAAGKPISALVVFSDGRSSERIGPEVWQLVRQTGAKLHVVPLGAEHPPLDLAIQRIDAPDRAFVNDTVVVRATVSQLGGAGSVTGDAPPGTVLQLIDTATGEVLDSKPVRTLDESVRLMTTPKSAGARNWKLVLKTDQPELVTDNNEDQIDLALVDRPIRLLYVEGYPRWEYRYLKNTLIREDSIESSIMLVSADRTFAQEGDVALRRLPANEEEMRPFDVIVIGDVPASFFSASQLKLIEQQVAVHGAGLLWIGGPQDTPGSYANTELAKLLPMTVDAAGPAPLNPPIVVKPTPVADSLGVLRLRDVNDTSESFWPDALPPLTWAQTLTPLKPTAEVLAEDETSGMPLVVRMRYPPGMTLYVGTDEVWRWRYARGDLYPEQFYMQLFRMLARSRLASGGDDSDRARLTISHRRASTGDTLVVELQLIDPSLIERRPETVEVDIAPAQTDGGAGGSTESRRITLTRDPDRPGRYAAPWTPRLDGRMVVKVADPVLGSLAGEQSVTITRSDDEMRYPAADHDTLGELAQRTGGKRFDAETLAELPKAIDNLARKTRADISEPLWNTPLAFAIVLVLLTVEWIGRKLLGLA